MSSMTSRLAWRFAAFLAAMVVLGAITGFLGMPEWASTLTIGIACGIGVYLIYRAR